MSSFDVIRLKDTPNFLVQLFKTGNKVFAFIKLAETTTGYKITIPEIYIPTSNIAFILHSTKNINTRTIIIKTDGEIIIEPVQYNELYFGFCVYKTS